MASMTWAITSKAASCSIRAVPNSVTYGNGMSSPRTQTLMAGSFRSARVLARSSVIETRTSSPSVT